MSELVAWFAQLMPESRRDWFELAGLAGSVLVAGLLGWAAWAGVGLWFDRPRKAKVKPLAAAVADAAVEPKRRRSPFAPKQRAEVSE